ncbi:MAG TPA: plastocyanin/azurin family copper-binding protein [Thermoplasmata archaeon]|nr:plastocyanin/azurin family copper-binding protein [Thermoplasmata archaeon]
MLLVVAGVMGLALVPALSASGGAPRASAGLRTTAGTTVELDVTVSDSLVFATSTNEIQPGDTVHVVVTQLGTTPHTFTLSPTAGFTFPSSDGASDLDTYFSAHAPLVNIQVGAATGAKFFGNFTGPPVGVYEYVCTEPGHFPGMSGLLGSGEAPGSLSTTNGPGAPVFIIAGVIVGLVVLALVLGFVVGKRRGSSDEMPPERLGYREPAAPDPQPPHVP